MATKSCILAWKIPWTEEPCGLQSLGSERVRHDLVTKQQQWRQNPYTVQTPLLWKDERQEDEEEKKLCAGTHCCKAWTGFLHHRECELDGEQSPRHDSWCGSWRCRQGVCRMSLRTRWEPVQRSEMSVQTRENSFSSEASILNKN